MNKQQLASKIWESANRMRSKIEANEYKDYILGFIFYKFLSDKEVRYMKEGGLSEEDLPTLEESDEETVTYLQKNIGYFIPYKHLFSTWLREGNDFTVDEVMEALSSFSRLISPTHKTVFENIFKTLETGLSKLGETSGARTRAIRGLISLIRDIPMDGRQDYDVLGFIYEYLISNFAANAGKKAGEFYTPHEVSLLISELVANHLKNRDHIEIYDPTSGSGSLLINIGQCAAKYMGKDDGIKYYAQELKENTYNLTRMNLVMRGIDPINIVTRNGDTLEEDWPWFDDRDPQNTYQPLFVDAVVSNPPYSQAWDPTDKETNERYANYGVAPKSTADYAFLLHDLYHLKPDGIMAIVLPHGVLFRGGAEGKIRKNLIEYNHIDAIIGLPANIFYGTGIPTIIMVLRKARPHTDVFIVDASKGFAKVGKNNMLRARDIKKIVDAVLARADIPQFSRRVSRDEIRANDYNLNIPRYVDASEAGEGWDIYASLFGGVPESELAVLAPYWAAFPHLKEDLFTAVNGQYWRPRAEDLAAVLAHHPDIDAFRAAFRAAFADLDTALRTGLVDQAETVHIPREMDRISDDIFRRLAPIPLIDRYEAYQLLDDQWKDIAIDLEIIQTEGMEAVKTVEPNLVLKKKNGRDEEIQEGWRGHVLPFDLVQRTLLPLELAALQAADLTLADKGRALAELVDELSEEDKSRPFVNDAGDAFVESEVKKALKQKTAEDATLAILTRAQRLMQEEKALKKQIKADTAALQEKTKETIEHLSDEDARRLLADKWITPLMARLGALPEMAVTTLTDRLGEIVKKYADTLEDVEADIRDTEGALAAMMGDLEGNEYDLAGLAELRALLGGK